MGLLRSIISAADGTVIFYMVLALIPNLFLILWAVARLSHEVRLLKHKTAMTENDINMLDESISNLSTQFQAVRKIENPTGAESTKTAPHP